MIINAENDVWNVGQLFVWLHSTYKGTDRLYTSRVQVCQVALLVVPAAARSLLLLRITFPTALLHCAATTLVLCAPTQVAAQAATSHSQPTH